MRRILMYKVELLQDNTYQVIQYCSTEENMNEFDFDKGRTVKFQGNLSDCNAWLQLNDKGYM